MSERPAEPPDLLAGFVGATLIDGTVIIGPSGPAFSAGMALQFDRGELVILQVADEWSLERKPALDR